jgi:hypothetical protein
VGSSLRALERSGVWNLLLLSYCNHKTDVFSIKKFRLNLILLRAMLFIKGILAFEFTLVLLIRLNRVFRFNLQKQKWFNFAFGNVAIRCDFLIC